MGKADWDKRSLSLVSFVAADNSSGHYVLAFPSIERTRVRVVNGKEKRVAMFMLLLFFCWPF